MLLHYALLWKGERSTWSEYATENHECIFHSWLVESYTLWWAGAQLPQWSSGDNRKFMDFTAKFLSRKKKRKKRLGNKCATEVQIYLIAWYKYIMSIRMPECLFVLSFQICFLYWNNAVLFISYWKTWICEFTGCQWEF